MNSVDEQNMDENLNSERSEHNVKTNSVSDDRTSSGGNVKEHKNIDNTSEIPIKAMVNVETDDSDEELNDQSVTRMIEALKINNNSKGVNNLLIPQVKKYYTASLKAIYFKYGVTSSVVLPEIYMPEKLKDDVANFTNEEVDYDLD